MTAIQLRAPGVRHAGRPGASILESVQAEGSVTGLLFELAVE